jgi:hypothetical protein
MEIVDGRKLRPSAAGAQQEQWDLENNAALASMYLSMSDDEVEASSGCQTAHEIWAKLNTMYQSVSGESKQEVWQKYYGIMASASKSPVKTMIHNYAAQLRSMRRRDGSGESNIKPHSRNVQAFLGSLDGDLWTQQSRHQLFYF